MKSNEEMSLNVDGPGTRIELPGISKRCDSPPLLAMNDCSTSTRLTGTTVSMGGSAGFHLESPMLTATDEPTSTSPHSRAVSKIDFEVITLIGYGQSGTVVQLVKSKATGAYYAMKTVDKWSLIEQRNSGDPKAIDRASAERDLHIRLGDSCAYFVKFFYSFQSTKNLYYILEYCPCDVLEYINQFGPLTIKDALLFIGELVVAVEHLHRSGSIHRDIKTDNILISTSGHVRLSDFGSSKRVENDRCDSVVGFSVSIMPPEFFSGNPSYGSAIDWFQVGICAYEVLTGQQPFSGRPLRTVDSPDYPPPWPVIDRPVPDTLKQLVEALLHPDEANRLSTFESIESHPALAGFSWKGVQAGDPVEVPFAHVAGDASFSSFATPRMMSSVSSDHEFDPLPFKSFSYIRP